MGGYLSQVRVTAVNTAVAMLWSQDCRSCSMISKFKLLQLTPSYGALHHSLVQDSTASSKTSPAGTQEPELEEKSAPRRTKRGSQPEHEVPSCTAGTRGPTAGSAEGLPRGVLLQTCKIGSMDPLAVPLDRVLEMTEAQLVQAMLDCPSKAFELPCDGREVRLEVAVSVSGRCNADTVWARLQGPQRVRDVLQIPASTCVAGCFLVIRNGYGVVDEDAVARAPGESFSGGAIVSRFYSKQPLLS